MQFVLERSVSNATKTTLKNENASLNTLDNRNTHPSGGSYIRTERWIQERWRRGMNPCVRKTIKTYHGNALVNWDSHPGDQGQIGGFGKGSDKIISKVPAPGENFEVKSPNPWGQISKGFKKIIHTSLTRNKIWKYCLNKAIVLFSFKI